MADSRALTRVVDELLWTLRREGFRIATSQAIDVARAVRAVGLANRAAMRDAIACVVVDRARGRARFDATFDAFFAAERAARGTLWERLAARGFDDAELAELRTLLGALATASADSFERLGVLLERGPELNRLLQLAGVRARSIAESPLQAGFYAHRVLDAVGVPKAYQSLATLRARLVDALGARGEALADALKGELERAGDDVRDARAPAHRATLCRREGRREAHRRSRDVRDALRRRDRRRDARGAPLRRAPARRRARAPQAGAEGAHRSAPHAPRGDAHGRRAVRAGAPPTTARQAAARLALRRERLGARRRALSCSSSSHAATSSSTGRGASSS